MSASSIVESGVVVIGAGVAGLAAAGRLRAFGVPTTLIEAGGRIGGRAWTVCLGGGAFDHGAGWLHNAESNPLVGLALAEDGLRDSDTQRGERVTVGGRLATAGELAAYEGAWGRLDAVVAPALLGPDVTLAAAMAPMMGEAWGPLVALWEGAIIAAVDADRLGLRDWHRNRLAGGNMVAADGIGAFVARRLGTAARLDTVATAVSWGGMGVTVETSRGTVRAGAAIVTVSTGVLAASCIRFDPPLPVAVQAAIHALPMGLLSKIVFRGLPGLSEGMLLVDRAGCMTFNARPQGRDQLVGFLGGDRAWAVADRAAAFEDLARAELGFVLGGAAVRALSPAVVTTGWGSDPAFAGAYAYAGPGDSDARGVLGAAFPGERLVFAGEAVRTDGLAGTVGGAYLSGIDAADRLLGS